MLCLHWCATQHVVELQDCKLRLCRRAVNRLEGPNQAAKVQLRGVYDLAIGPRETKALAR